MLDSEWQPGGLQDSGRRSPGTKGGDLRGRHKWVQFTPAGVTESSYGQYIAGQEAHHRNISFVGELKHLLERNGVDYDPKYLL